MIIKRVTPWLLVVLCIVAISCFSAQSNDDSHVVSDDVVRAVANVMVDGFDTMSASDQAIVVKSFDLPVRKIAHTTEYGILGILLFLALGFSHAEGEGKVSRLLRRINRTLGGRCGAALIACFLFSCVDEFHQLFVVGRTARFTDCLIDTFGALVGILIVCAIVAIVRDGGGGKRGAGSKVPSR